MARRRRGALSRWADRQIARQEQIARDSEKNRQRQAVAQLVQKAERRTAAVRAREIELRQILRTRPRGLQARRGEVARTFKSRGVIAMVELVERVLTDAERLDQFPDGCEAGYEPEARAIRVRYELPTLEETVPDSVGSRYVKAKKDVEKIHRRPADRHAVYRQALARTTVRALADIFDITPPDLVHRAAVNGYVATTDPSTGQPSEFTLVDRDDLAAHSRIDLLAMHHRDFEELVRELFEAMKFTAWRTADSHDEGIDVYATADEEITGMECVIQAKRYRRVVKPDHIRSLHGALTDKNAHKGFLVTTAWFGPQSYAYAERNRIELISGGKLRQLLHDHLGFDVFIPLEKLPAGWQPDDIA